ncbi:hypothetical protein [Streptomyces sp. NPDC005970]
MELENAGAEERVGTIDEPQFECADVLGGESAESRALDAAELRPHGAPEI